MDFLILAWCIVQVSWLSHIEIVLITKGRRMGLNIFSGKIRSQYLDKNIGEVISLTYYFPNSFALA